MGEGERGYEFRMTPRQGAEGGGEGGRQRKKKKRKKEEKRKREEKKKEKKSREFLSRSVKTNRFIAGPRVNRVPLISLEKSASTGQGDGKHPAKP